MTSGAAAILRGNDTVFGGLVFSQSGECVPATGDLDEFRDPANAADERFVPLLEIDLRLWPAANQRRHLAKARFVAPGERFRLIHSADQCAKGVDHRENAGDVTLIERMHGNAGANELSRDRRLEIRKGKDEVWLKGENFWNVGRSKGRNARLLPPDSRRPYGIAGHAGNAVLLTEKVECFDRLLRQADDPGGWKFAQ